MHRICIIGAGPAGSTLAARLAQLGHDVWLIERATFPRPRLGESLSPGVLPLLETIGVGQALDPACARQVSGVQIKWDHGREERGSLGQQGLLVNRGRFDALLLERARALGVRVLQPAVAREQRGDEHGWLLRIDVSGRRVDLRADFLADARGRSAGVLARARSGSCSGARDCRTLALHAYWSVATLPARPRIEAGPDEWYWGVPLPDGTYNTMVFRDLERYQADPAQPVADRLVNAIARSGLLEGCGDARLVGRVRITEATPYLAPDSVTARSIKVGDAALAIDPLSSSGVQKAIQTALAGAIVVNTVLRKPESREAAFCFYRTSLEEAANRHRGWAAAQYAAVAAERGGRFWHDRAGAVLSRPQPASTIPPVPASQLDRQVRLSPELDLVDRPCLDGDFVVEKTAVVHPGLDGPAAYVGGLELVPLLRQWRSGMTGLDLARAWMPVVAPPRALELVAWLLARGLLVRDS